jgi:molecular chaperone GrpE
MSDIRDDELDPDVERASEIDHVTDVTDVADASDVADVAEVADTGTESDLEQVIEHDLESLLAERDQFRDIALRLQADFENYRKRVAQQSAEEVVRASARLAEALLPVLDAAEAAYVRHPDEIGPLLNVMLAELRKQGLGTLDLLDQPFDPTVAEAVAHQPGEGGDVVVAEVLRSGYTWQGRTLRPAMVRTRD